MTRIPEVPMNFTQFFSVLLFWHPEKKKEREDEERHFHSTQRKVGLKEVKWIVLPHFSFWDFLVSVNNRPSARTSHTCKHTPLSTSPPHSGLRGAEFPPRRWGVWGWGQGGRPELPATWNPSPHGSCTPSPPGSVRQVFVSLISTCLGSFSTSWDFTSTRSSQHPQVTGGCPTRRHTCPLLSHQTWVELLVLPT